MLVEVCWLHVVLLLRGSVGKAIDWHEALLARSSVNDRDLCLLELHAPPRAARQVGGNQKGSLRKDHVCCERSMALWLTCEGKRLNP